MPVRRDKRGVWRYRKVLCLPDGTRRRISGTPAINKRWAAEKAEETEIRRLLDAAAQPKPRKEVPTFEEWFLGRYMREWCEAQHNKPSTVDEKRSIFDHHLRGFLGPLRLDAIDVGVIQALKAAMNERANRYAKPLSLKTRNNVLVEGDPAQAREILARHIQPLVLTPTEVGYQITGAFDLATVIRGADSGVSENGSRRDPLPPFSDTFWLPLSGFCSRLGAARAG